MLKQKTNGGFTLVELIIVITILAILGTIGFVSFQGYTRDARDSNRLATIQNIQSGLEVFKVKSGYYPEPDNITQITASGIVLTKQGEFGETQSSIIKMNQTPLDPSDKLKYIYAINAKNNKYQLLTYLENNQTSFIKEAYAEDLTSRTIKSFGKEVGILLDLNNNPISGTGFEILSNTGNTYNLVFTTNKLTLTGSEVLSMYSSLNKDISYLDNSLVGYWDMETTTISGSQIVLKDLSKYGNNGTCYNNGVGVDCGGNLGPKFINGNGITGKSMSFDGIDDYIKTTRLKSLNGDNETIIFLLTFRDATNGNVLLSEDWSRRLTYNNWMLYVDGIINYPQLYSTYSQILNKKTLLGYTSNGTNINIFSNGFKKQSIDNSLNGKIKSGGGIYFFGMVCSGNSADNCGNFNGTIDEVRIYNRALSDEEIKILYNSIN